MFFKEFSIDVFLEEEQGIKQLECAEFFLDGERLDLLAYCKAKVDMLDLSNYRIAKDHLEYYEKGSEFLYHHDLTFTWKNAHLFYAGEKKSLLGIRIKIPAKGYMAEVDPRDVLT